MLTFPFGPILYPRVVVNEKVLMKKPKPQINHFSYILNIWVTMVLKVISLQIIVSHCASVWPYFLPLQKMPLLEVFFQCQDYTVLAATPT